MKNLKIVEVGGRIKAASIGLNELYETDDIVHLEEHLKSKREKPTKEMLVSFFPSENKRIKQLLSGVGFYRPMLKTDQGMGGNFLPFYIDMGIEKTILEKGIMEESEMLAIPEIHYQNDPEKITEVQNVFFQKNMQKTIELLNQNGSRRYSEKGRESFFLIRPCMTKNPIIFGKDVVKKVENAIKELIQKIDRKAKELKTQYGYDENCNENNLLYMQPDVFILKDGSVHIEKINCPDVGFFMTELQHGQSEILPKVQNIVSELKEKVCEQIAKTIKNRELTIVTRNEVIHNKEDMLEILEIQSLKAELEKLGKKVSVIPVSAIADVPSGSCLLLLNIMEKGKVNTSKEMETLLQRYCNKDITCYPNPFFQMACNEISGLRELKFSNEKATRYFLDLTSSEFKQNEKSGRDAGMKKVHDQIIKTLKKGGMESDIIYADIGPETVPIFSRSLHSWRQLKRRMQKYESSELTLRGVPGHFQNLLLESATGPHLHVFRFMCTIVP